MKGNIKYNGAFGIQIEDNVVRLVKVNQKGGEIQIEGYAKRQLADDVVSKGLVKKHQVLAETIIRAMHDAVPQHVREKRVIVSVPEHKSFVKIIDLPLMEDEEIKEAIKWEAEDNIPLPIEKVYFDWKVLERFPATKKMKVLLVAASRNVIDSRMEVFDQCGLIPVGFEPDSFALNRCLKPLRSNTPKEEVVVCISESNSVIFVRKGEDIMFSSSVFFSVNQLIGEIVKLMATDQKGGIAPSDEEVQQKKGEVSERILKFGFDTKYPEGKEHFNYAKGFLGELVKEIKDALNYFEGDKETEIDTIYLTGAGAALKGMDMLLGMLLEREVKEGRELENYPVVHNVLTMPKEMVAEYSVVLGSALAGVKF